MKHPALGFLIGILVATLIGLASTGPARAGEGCISTVMPEKAALPDGTPIAAGDELTLCAMREFTPVSVLHATYLNGMPVRQLLSRRGTSEGLPAGPPRPFMIFDSDEEGRLQLYGFATPSRDRLVTYTLADAPSTRAQRLAAAAARKARGTAATAAVNAVVIAATAR